MSNSLKNKNSHIEMLQKEIEILKIDNSNLKTIVINLQKLLDITEGDSVKQYNSTQKQYNELQKELDLIKKMIESKKLGSASNPYENNKLFNPTPQK